MPKGGPKASPPLNVLEAQTLVTRRANVPGGGALRKYCSVLCAWLSTQPAQGLPGLSGTGLLHLHLLDCSNPSWTLLLASFSFLARVGLCRLQSEASVMPHLKPLQGVISEMAPPSQASPSVCGLLFLLYSLATHWPLLSWLQPYSLLGPSACHSRPTKQQWPFPTPVVSLLLQVLPSSCK